MYTDFLRHFGDAVKRKRPEKWRSNNWFHLHDNAPAYRPVLAKDFEAKNDVTTTGHPAILS